MQYNVIYTYSSLEYIEGLKDSNSIPRLEDHFSRFACPNAFRTHSVLPRTSPALTGQSLRGWPSKRPNCA